jgi:hypothetical protein
VEIKTKVIIVSVLVVAVIIFYFAAFYGERTSFITDSVTYYESNQSFCGIIISEEKSTDPENAPIINGHGQIGPAQYWRGFGFIWQTTVYYE